MLWLDNFLFDGEEIAFTRLKYLFPVVDKFYICEKGFTHQGVKKDKLYIDLVRKRFEPYLTKIEFAVDYSWGDENSHRNFCASKILTDYPDEQYIITVCDVDEIPDASLMPSVKEGLYNKCAEGCIYMEMTAFCYNLNWLREESWTAAFVVNDILLKEHKEFQKFRDQRGPIFGVFECGRYFSYFMSVKEMERKLGTEFKDKQFIFDCLMNGKDLCKRDDVTIVQNKVNKNTYPKEIVELHRKTMEAQFSG